MVRLKTLVGLGAILGGLCWVAAYVAARADSSDAVLGMLFWVGFVLMTAAFLGAGVNLVRVGNHWLELVVGVATPALVWSVVWAFKSTGNDDAVVDGVFGALAAVFGLVTMLRRSRRADEGPQVGRRRAA